MTVGQSGPLPPAAVLQVAVLWIYMQCDTPMPPYIKAIKVCSMTSHQPGATNYAFAACQRLPHCASNPRLDLLFAKAAQHSASPLVAAPAPLVQSSPAGQQAGSAVTHRHRNCIQMHAARLADDCNKAAARTRCITTAAVATPMHAWHIVQQRGGMMLRCRCCWSHLRP